VTARCREFLTSSRCSSPHCLSGSVNADEIVLWGKQVREAEIHLADLVEESPLLQSGKPPLKIEPLR